MNAFQIKVLAIICMVISHVSIFLLPHHPILQIIGATAFPLFAWLLANGAYHSKDLGAYLKRLVAFAFISQIPFTLANQQIGSPLLYLNVFFTLSLGLYAISVIRKTDNHLVWLAVIFGCAATAQVVSADYGAAGVLTIVAFYLTFNNLFRMISMELTILYLLPSAISFLEKTTKFDFSYVYLDHPVNGWALIAAFGVISFYNRHEGPKFKYLFYAFYPLHYFIIYLLKIL